MERIAQAGSLRITRRQFAIGSALASAACALPRFGPGALAGQADLASAGYPTLDVTVTASAFEGLPETLEAGRYLINVTVADDVVDGGGVAFLQPYEMSAEEFFGFLGGGPPPEASPEAVAEAGGEEGGEEGGGLDLLPAFVYQSHFAGGAAAMPGGFASTVLDLTEGEWIAWGDDPEAAQMPVVFTVTGEFPADVADPESDITFHLVDFGIMVEGNLVAGDHVVMIDNQGAQPHFVDLSIVPDGTTNDDLEALLGSFMTGTPVAGGIGEADFQSVAYTPTQSIDVQLWTTMTLEAGTYAALCWFPTAGLGDPHAFHGMHTVFEVTA